MTEKPRKVVAAVDCILSEETIQLYNSINPHNVNEAITVLFHACLLESGFIPLDLSSENKYESMPNDWNAKSVFKIKYVHYCCPSFISCMTVVPLYNNVSVLGIICDGDCSESIDIKMNLSKYVKTSKNFSNKGVFDIFCNLDEFSIFFKDNFCLPFLNLLHETVGRNRLFGFLGLFDELKVYILQFLPVECVMSMSAVNKNFHDLANSSHLWKYLFMRDFAKDGVPDINTTSSENNWKEMYQKEYMKRKRKPLPRHYMFPHYRLPQIFSVGPDFDTDVGIRFDPPFFGPHVYEPPFLPPRLPPFFRRLL